MVLGSPSGGNPKKLVTRSTRESPPRVTTIQYNQDSCFRQQSSQHSHSSPPHIITCPIDLIRKLIRFYLATDCSSTSVVLLVRLIPCDSKKVMRPIAPDSFRINIAYIFGTIKVPKIVSSTKNITIQATNGLEIIREHWQCCFCYYRTRIT